MKSKADLEEKMRKCLERLGVPLQVVWMPRDEGAIRGEIKSNIILIYARDEAQAWLTFEHEVYEYKFKEVTFPYRNLFNAFVDAIEKMAYERKEKFLQSIPKISEIIAQERED